MGFGSPSTVTLLACTELNDATSHQCLMHDSLGADPDPASCPIRPPGPFTMSWTARDHALREARTEILRLETLVDLLTAQMARRPNRMSGPGGPMHGIPGHGSNAMVPDWTHPPAYPLPPLPPLPSIDSQDDLPPLPVIETLGPASSAGPSANQTPKQGASPAGIEDAEALLALKDSTPTDPSGPSIANLAVRPPGPLRTFSAPGALYGARDDEDDLEPGGQPAARFDLPPLPGQLSLNTNVQVVATDLNSQECPVSALDPAKLHLNANLKPADAFDSSSTRGGTSVPLYPTPIVFPTRHPPGVSGDELERILFNRAAYKQALQSPTRRKAARELHRNRYEAALIWMMRREMESSWAGQPGGVYPQRRHDSGTVGTADQTFADEEMVMSEPVTDGGLPWRSQEHGHDGAYEDETWEDDLVKL